MTGRLVVVGVVVLAVLVGNWWYRRARATDAGRGGSGLPALPGDLAAGVPTWVVFTTPLCASCEQVAGQLRAAFPAERVVLVDATEQPELAEAYAVRRAPTVVRAEAGGQVTDRLVGVEGVRAHLQPA